MFLTGFLTRLNAKVSQDRPETEERSVGFCAVDNGKMICNIGIMDMATRTLDGTVEYAGDLYGFATLPVMQEKAFARL
jgi:hypothetical protein